jgi:dipeptidyl-peptidase-4
VTGTGTRITFVANEIDIPWVHNVWSVNPDGTGLTNLTPVDGIVSASAGGSVTVTRTATLTASRAMFAVHADNREIGIRSLAEEPLVNPNVRIMTVGGRRIPVAVLTPRDGGNGKLPVLFDPYGGPHAQRVLASNAAFATSQWFADQGYVVVVADNRGTPGLGSAWEREVFRDLAGPVLEDQVEVALALEGIEPRADTSRIAIRGWSFGGYLAALAVLRAPGVFRAAIAGAPVTDWRLYDTHYTERYLGNPAVDDAPYAATSLIEDAHLLTRPLLLIHGLADDNVVAAHTLQFSSALLAAGKPHEVLPLSGVTHMTPQEVVAENLLLHQLEFLRRTVG